MNVDPDDLRFASEVVRAAGTLARAMRGDVPGAGIEADSKANVADLVTAADHAAERLVAERLAAARPDDGVLGEEGVSRAGASGRRWLIDPVDGTWNFVTGLDHWCSALALEHEDTDAALLGAIHHPARDRVWLGGPDLGTRCDDVDLPMLPDAPLAEVGVATYLHPTFFGVAAVAAPWARTVARAAAVRMLGSSSMDLVSVAAGGIGCWFQHSVQPWDWRPGEALVLGVGGATEKLQVDGYEWCVAGRPTAVREVVASLRGAARGEDGEDGDDGAEDGEEA